MAITNTGIVERTITGVNESDLFLDSEATSSVDNTGIVERSIVGVHDANFVRPLGDNELNTGVISNAGGGSFTFTDSGLKAISDGTSGFALRPRVLWSSLTIGREYRIVGTPTINSGSTNYAFYNGASYEKNQVAVEAFDITFTCNGTAVFFTNDGRQAFDIDWDLSLKEVLVNRESTTTNTGVVERSLTGVNESIAFRQDVRTNLLPYSQDFSNVAWAKTRCTIDGGGHISPSGASDAFKMTATDNDARLQDLNRPVGVIYTQSVYVKSATGNDVSGQIDFTGTFIQTFTANNEWQRVETTSDTTRAGVFRVRITNSGDELLVWGAQLEEAAHATSYIPTNGAPVTIDSNSTSVVNNTGIVERPITGVNESDPMFPNNTISNITNTAGSVYWYASQLGAGTKDGTSEANASDISGIPYGSMGLGDNLYLMGTVTDTVRIETNDINVRGDLAGKELTLDATGLNAGLIVDSKTGLKIYGGTYTNATVSNIHLEGTAEVETFNAITTNSGNQNVQHLDDTIAIHNNITATGGFDDGISGHERANITLNGDGTNISGNNQGVNVIEHCVVNINCNIGANTSEDVSLTNNFGSGVATANLNNCSAGVVIANRGSKIVLNNANITTSLDIEGVSAAFGEVEANNSVIKQLRADDSDSIGNYTQCLIVDNLYSLRGTHNFYKCRILGDFRMFDAVEFKWCLFSNENTTQHTIDANNVGDIKAHYNIFSNVTTGKFGLVADSGSTVEASNNTFLGNGRGMYSNTAFTTANNIFSDLSIGYFASAVVPTLDNNCFFDNGTDINGTATNNNAQTTSPLLVDTANNDFSLGAGSSCIGTGKTLTESEGIDIAIWGNGVNETPVVTTKTQGASWDIGAYVS